MKLLRALKAFKDGFIEGMRNNKEEVTTVTAVVVGAVAQASVETVGVAIVPSMASAVMVASIVVASISAYKAITKYIDRQIFSRENLMRWYQRRKESVVCED